MASKGNDRNDARRNGKAAKQHPGVSPKAHNGKTVGGYSPERAEQRAAARRLQAAIPNG